MPIAVLIPGSASTGDFMRRAFAEIVAGCDVRVVSDPSGDAGRIADRIETAIDSDRRLRCVIGMSVGAHAAAIWAARHDQPTCPLVLAMPAWTGDPGPVAAVTAQAAVQLRAGGVPAELARLRSEFGDDWVVSELAAAWAAQPLDSLVTSLAGTASSLGPTPAQLQAIGQPAVVVALDGDPMHPASVAEQWASLIPGARLVRLARQTPGLDGVGVFGAVVAPWLPTQADGAAGG